MMALLLAGLLLPGRRLVALGGRTEDGSGERRDADTSSRKAGGIGCWEGCVLQTPGEDPEGGGRALESDAGEWGLLLTALLLQLSEPQFLKL